MVSVDVKHHVYLRMKCFAVYLDQQTFVNAEGVVERITNVSCYYYYYYYCCCCCCYLQCAVICDCERLSWYKSSVV